MSASEESIFTRPFAPMLFERGARARAVLLPLSARSRARDLSGRVPRRAVQPTRHRCVEQPTSTAIGRRGAGRADAAGRGRHDRVAARVSRRCPAAVRPIRHADDRRRSADRIRPHGADVRVRARRRQPGHHLPVEGADGRLPAARRDASPRSRFTRRS